MYHARRCSINLLSWKRTWRRSRSSHSLSFFKVRQQKLEVRSQLFGRLYNSMASGEGLDRSLFTVPNDVPISLLDCRTAFDALTPKEKLYAHYLAEASFNGGLIVLLQTSPEAPAIFLLLQHLFCKENAETLRSAATSAPNGPTDTEFEVKFQSFE